MRQVSLTHVVVGSRYHNIVYALKMGKPVISTGYSPKHRALMEEVGLGEFTQAAQEIDVEKLQDQFLKLSKNYEMYERSVEQANARFRELREEQERILATRFLGGGRV